jgi:hypothetical protein
VLIKLFNIDNVPLANRKRYIFAHSILNKLTGEKILIDIFRDGSIKELYRVLPVEESPLKPCCEGRIGQNLTFCRSMLSYQDALLC